MEDDGGRGGATPEYERQRISRIRENRARLEALGLPGLASSLHARPPPSKRRERREKANKRGAGDDDDDDDYQPSDGEKIEGQEGRAESSSSNEEEEGEEQGRKRPSSGSRRKGKKRSSTKAAKVTGKGKMREPDDGIDDDAALKQAIALSLGERMEDLSEDVSGYPQNSDTHIANSGPRRKKDKGNAYEPAGRRKNKIVNKRRVQLTEDEVIAYFFSFDEVGKGYITQWDLKRMAIAHDFSWTESEIFNMIHCFDSDGDGKLSLEDFRSIICRCNMIQDGGQQ